MKLTLDRFSYLTRLPDDLQSNKQSSHALGGIYAPERAVRRLVQLHSPTGNFEPVAVWNPLMLVENLVCQSASRPAVR